MVRLISNITLHLRWRKNVDDDLYLAPQIGAADARWPANVSSLSANGDDNRNAAFAPSCFAIGNATLLTVLDVQLTRCNSCGTDAFRITFFRQRLSLTSLLRVKSKNDLTYVIFGPVTEGRRLEWLLPRIDIIHEIVPATIGETLVSKKMVDPELSYWDETM